VTLLKGDEAPDGDADEENGSALDRLDSEDEDNRIEEV
jgi:hypothetical protein